MDQLARKTVGTYQGETVEEITLVSDTGVELAILTYGALIRDWQVPVGGAMRSVVLGFDDFAPYPDKSPYFGAICGRVANRVGGARFTLDDKTYALVPNEGENQLHGGPGGFAKRVWSVADQSPDSVTLILSSPDGDMGYPGVLEASVTYRLQGYRLDIDFSAQTDTRTPVNIVQHNYFNLMGTGDVLDHGLEIMGSAITELDEAQIPTGAILPVAGTHLDFSAARSMRGDDGSAIRIDQNYALATGRNGETPVARLTAPDGSLVLSLYTDQPGLQVYNAYKIDPPMTGRDGATYSAFSGICLEDQGFPDAINHSHFPTTIIGPDAPYRHRCGIEIAP